MPDVDDRLVGTLGLIDVVINGIIVLNSRHGGPEEVEDVTRLTEDHRGPRGEPKTPLDHKGGLNGLPDEPGVRRGLSRTTDTFPPEYPAETEVDAVGRPCH